MASSERAMCSFMLSIWIEVRFWRVDVVMEDTLDVIVVFLDVLPPVQINCNKTSAPPERKKLVLVQIVQTLLMSHRKYYVGEYKPRETN